MWYCTHFKMYIRNTFSEPVKKKKIPLIKIFLSQLYVDINIFIYSFILPQ